ncbi:aspartate-alanine antiporter [Acidobacterium sp. S8]|uniref:aspartate-alanine antiporter n=1 Tax=Acidobacterium sp. S8 TaxID=1641854 RepID=UPI00131CE8E4|nr:aspartate-alanine antiporter [Acidobacterium sp. S8]
MQWLVGNLRDHPEIALFLVLAVGAWVGSWKFKGFSLGVVTSTLLAGVLVGQLNIVMSSNVKSVFFLMFLFAVGYGVGPQFFRGLRSGGLQQVIFAVIVCVACLLSTFVVAKLLHYDVGLAAGLLSGACTISAVLGVATDSINQLAISPEQKKALIDVMPVAYAVTYIFGTAGSAWFLATLGPKILRVDLPKAAKELEAEMGAGEMEPGVISAYQGVVARAYQVTNPKLIGRTVSDIEATAAQYRATTTPAESPSRVFIEQIRQGGIISPAETDTVVQEGAVIAVVGHREAVLLHDHQVGPEVNDRELLDFPGERLDVVLTNKELGGKTLRQIMESPLGQKGRGVFLRKLMRGGIEMPYGPNTELDRGDVLTLVGAKREVETAAKVIGYADRATENTDMVFLGIGIVVGALVGAITIHVGGVPLSLSTSGGALIAGLVCGWLRSVNRTFGRIPGPALWVFNNVGLNTFIAVVGLTSGPGFVRGLQQNGLSLFFAGVVVTTLPFIIGLLVGKYIFKMNAALLLGACAGARTTTAALGAIQEAAESKTPALGYTVTYAVGNTLLIIWGVVIVLMMK